MLTPIYRMSFLLNGDIRQSMLNFLLHNTIFFTAQFGRGLVNATREVFYWKLR